jgi:AraC-like DNA-binding protein
LLRRGQLGTERRKFSVLKMLKMLKALKMLRKGSNTVDRVAWQFGYDDEEYDTHNG